MVVVFNRSRIILQKYVSRKCFMVAFVIALTNVITLYQKYTRFANAKRTIE